jgi:hypothetical protein
MPPCGPKSPRIPHIQPKLERVGDHIRQRRLDLRPRQRDAADRLGVDKATDLQLGSGAGWNPSSATCPPSWPSWARRRRWARQVPWAPLASGTAPCEASRSGVFARQPTRCGARGTPPACTPGAHRRRTRRVARPGPRADTASTPCTCGCRACYTIWPSVAATARIAGS